MLANLSHRSSRPSRRRNRHRLLRPEQLEQRMLLCFAALGEIRFDTTLESLQLTGGPYPISLASDPGNLLGDSVDGYGFVDSMVTFSLSSERAVSPGPTTTGETCAFPGGIPLVAPAETAALVGVVYDPIDPQVLDGQLFHVDSFFDVFFDITVTDVDARPGRDFAGQPDGASIQLFDNGPASTESNYYATFDKDAPNFGLFPPPQANPLIGFSDIEIPLGADINGNVENDKIKFTIGSIAADDANRTFIELPDGTVINQFDAAGLFEGAIVDEITDPPFTIGSGIPGAPAFTGPTTATSYLVNEVITYDPLVYVSSELGGSIGGVTFADDDIIVHDTGSDTWSMHFDGSDVGVRADIDAFHIDYDDSILMSLKTASFMPGLGTVRPEDIIRFMPSSLGDTTAGSFSWYLDGSTAGLSSYSENIDAIAIDPFSGNLVVSTTGNHNVPGAGSGKDRDLISWDGNEWSKFLVGADVGLNYSAEDITGAWIDPGFNDFNGELLNSVPGSYDTYVNVLKHYSIPGLSGGRADIFNPTSGDLLYDGDDFNNARVDGIFVELPFSPKSVAENEGDQSTSLSTAELSSVTAAAIDRWIDAGISADQVALLNQVTFEIVDLPGAVLGTAAGTSVQIDVSAAGNGWFIDSSPLDDSEFDANGSATDADAIDRTDLLTTVMHELGHVLGFGHVGGLMSDVLGTGTRHDIDDELLDLLVS